ncbi:unnamed protein product [Toxocara canis]|uniref:cardiolipin synthase (CMP-forming) n=1 Tax=Toxocara canis TaxID=6265 RepID=A0A183VAY9_TOXCA|nr:unnamed protein product [Toxocara canis]
MGKWPVAVEAVVSDVSSHVIARERCRLRRFASRLYGTRWQGLLTKVVHPDVRVLATTTATICSNRQCAIKENVKRLREQFVEQKKQFRAKIITIPNALSMIRIGLSPIIGCLVVEECFVAAVSLFTVAGITDLTECSIDTLQLDGYIARHVEGQSSLLGSVLDPIADKLLVSTLFITLTYVNLIPLLLTVTVLVRDICLVTGGFVKRYRMLMPPITLRRFFDPSVSPIKVAPTFVSKVNTALQLSLVACSLASPVFNFAGHPSLTALCFATGATTIFSGLQYALMDRMQRVYK